MRSKKGDLDKDMVGSALLILVLLLLLIGVILVWREGGINKATSALFDLMRLS